MARSVSAHQLHPTAGAIQFSGKQLNQSLICCRIHRGGSYLDAQFIAYWFADFICKSARLQSYGKPNTIGLYAQIGRQRHIVC